MGRGLPESGPSTPTSHTPGPVAGVRGETHGARPRGTTSGRELCPRPSRRGGASRGSTDPSQSLFLTYPGTRPLSPSFDGTPGRPGTPTLLVPPWVGEGPSPLGSSAGGCPSLPSHPHLTHSSVRHTPDPFVVPPGVPPLPQKGMVCGGPVGRRGHSRDRGGRVGRLTLHVDGEDRCPDTLLPPALSPVHNPLLPQLPFSVGLCVRLWSTATPCPVGPVLGFLYSVSRVRP